MHHRRTSAADRHRAGPRQERGLTYASFVGSFPAADFRLDPALPEIAFLGRSNVGKSALINAFTGRRALARTSRTPGKTRTCNVFAIGDRFYLVDLPGYGYARAAKTARRGFQQLLRDYLSGREELAGVVWLLDVRREPTADDRAMAQLLAARDTPMLVAITKADKLARARRTERARTILQTIGIPGDQVVVTSARTRDGIGELRDAVERLVDRLR
jgi:GTP-binding protein